MGKLIIRNESSLSDIQAIEIVGKVIEEGRISDNGKSYCYLSIYNLQPTKVAVSVRRNGKSDTFVLWDSKHKD
tara:strand:+ start:2670 stop:2888 length:219 start_codon:yes stop_codon:yes gene_type:complete